MECNRHFWQTFTWLYLWAHCCHLLPQRRGCCTHSVGWMLEGHWSPPAPWWETGWGSEAGGWAGHRQELKRGLSPHLRAGLMGDGVQPWWQAEHWPEILRREGHTVSPVYSVCETLQVCVFEYALFAFMCTRVQAHLGRSESTYTQVQMPVC